MNNKKLLMLPTLVLSSMLLLTACTSGNNESGSPVPSISSTPSDSSSESSNPNQNEPLTSSEASSTEEEIVVVDGYIEAPTGMNENYVPYFTAPSLEGDPTWSTFKDAGARTYKEDSSLRSTTPADWDSVRGNDSKMDDFHKIYGELRSDVEANSLLVTQYLKDNKKATLEEIKSENLLINRYEQLGKMNIEQDASTGFYFIIFYNLEEESPMQGILVEQDGITPSFDGI